MILKLWTYIKISLKENPSGTRKKQRESHTFTEVGDKAESYSYRPTKPQRAASRHKTQALVTYVSIMLSMKVRHKCSPPLFPCCRAPQLQTSLNMVQR